MSEDFEASEPAHALPVVGAVVVLVAVALPWVTVSAGPVTPTTAGYETIYGLLAAILAVVVLVDVVAGLSDRRSAVSLLGGAAIALIAGARFVTLDGAASAGIGVHVAILGGLLAAVGGVLGR